MEKKSNFSIIPNWLIDEFKTAKEFQAYLKMYNGWCLMKDADGWYYRSISKLKEDFGMNPNCSRTRVTQLIKRFEELGILNIKSNGKGTNWYKFDEVVLFNHIEENEEEGREQVVPQGREQVVPHQEEGVGNKLYPLYNTKENIKENILELDDTSTRDQNEIKEKNEPLDIELEPETDINNMLEYTCTGEDNSKNQHNMKIDERLITEVEKDAWEILDISDDFDYSQYENISEMVQSDARNIGMLENPTYFEKKKNNEYVSKEFKKLSYYIKEYKNSTSVEMANEWGCKVNDLYGSLDRSKFTETQLGTISDMMDEFDFLFECKEKFLSKKYHKSSMMKKKSVSNENATKKVVADEDNEMMFRAYCTDEELIAMGFEVEEPMVAYGNSSVQEAQQQFAMALAANG